MQCRNHAGTYFGAQTQIHLLRAYLNFSLATNGPGPSLYMATITAIGRDVAAQTGAPVALEKGKTF